MKIRMNETRTARHEGERRLYIGGTEYEVPSVVGAALVREGSAVKLSATADRKKVK